MEKNQIDKIIRLGKKHTYIETDQSYLDKLEKDLYKVVHEDELNEKATEVLAKFLYERKKYKRALFQFNKLLEINPNKIGSYYGMYKCYLMLDDYVNSYKNIIKYIEKTTDKKAKLGFEIILSSYDVIFNNNYNYKINQNEYFLMNKIIDEELKEKYMQLIEKYNLQNYSECLKLAVECEKICRNKNILIEFSTFQQLLKKVNIITRENIRNNLSNLYSELEQAIEYSDFSNIIKILNIIPKINLKNDKLVYNAIYVLIKNNYINESQQILNTFIIKKDNNLIIKTLKQAINNQIEYNQLTEEQKENYKIAIEQGHIYYQEDNLQLAYYMYTFGEYTTRNNIFKYYIGKILYKLEQYEEAEEYFKEYIKVGSDKISKAYFYLALIYKNKRKYKKASHYGQRVNILDKIFATNFIYDNYYDPNIDSVKMKLQKEFYMHEDCFK